MDKNDTSAGSNNIRPSFYLKSVDALQKALFYHLAEAEKFQRLKEEDRTPDLAQQYMRDAKSIQDIWSALPRKNRRKINPNRFSKIIKKRLTRKANEENDNQENV